MILDVLLMGLGRVHGGKGAAGQSLLPRGVYLQEVQYSLRAKVMQHPIEGIQWRPPQPCAWPWPVAHGSLATPGQPRRVHTWRLFRTRVGQE